MGINVSQMRENYGAGEYLARQQEAKISSDAFLSRLHEVIEDAAAKAGVSYRVAQICLANAVTPRRGLIGPHYVYIPHSGRARK